MLLLYYSHQGRVKSLQTRYNRRHMKRNIGTVVLFVLLLLTVVAIQQLDAAESTTLGSAGEVKHVTN